MAADGSRETIYSYEWVECINELIHAHRHPDCPAGKKVTTKNLTQSNDLKNPQVIAANFNYQDIDAYANARRAGKATRTSW